jgi:hypothetical protein
VNAPQYLVVAPALKYSMNSTDPKTAIAERAEVKSTQRGNYPAGHARLRSIASVALEAQAESNDLV